MENHLMELVKKMKTSNVEREEETVTRFGETITYDYHVIKSDEATLRFWNSSNSSGIHNISSVLDDIRSEVLDEEMGGTVYDGWNELMWEIIE